MKPRHHLHLTSVSDRNGDRRPSMPTRKVFLVNLFVWKLQWWSNLKLPLWCGVRRTRRLYLSRRDQPSLFTGRADRFAARTEVRDMPA